VAIMRGSSVRRASTSEKMPGSPPRSSRFFRITARCMEACGFTRSCPRVAHQCVSLSTSRKKASRRLIKYPCELEAWERVLKDPFQPVAWAISPQSRAGSPTRLAERTVTVGLVNHTHGQKREKFPTDQGGRTRAYPMVSHFDEEDPAR